MLSGVVFATLSEDVCSWAQRSTLNDMRCSVRRQRWLFLDAWPLSHHTAGKRFGTGKGKGNILITFNVLWRRIQIWKVKQCLRAQPRLIACTLKMKCECCGLLLGSSCFCISLVFSLCFLPVFLSCCCVCSSRFQFIVKKCGHPFNSILYYDMFRNSCLTSSIISAKERDGIVSKQEK